MTAVPAKAVLDKLAEAFTSGRTGGVAKLFSDSYLDHQQPPGEAITGPEEFQLVVAGARSWLSNLEVHSGGRRRQGR